MSIECRPFWKLENQKKNNFNFIIPGKKKTYSRNNFWGHEKACEYLISPLWTRLGRFPNYQCQYLSGRIPLGGIFSHVFGSKVPRKSTDVFNLFPLTSNVSWTAKQKNSVESHPMLPRWWFQPIWKILSSQNGNLPRVGVKIKNIWNHHPVTGWWRVVSFYNGVYWVQTPSTVTVNSEKVYERVPNCKCNECFLTNLPGFFCSMLQGS